MQPALLNLINGYGESAVTKKELLREILQQCALLGLSRHAFFEHAAFYGGTALRILYGLDRFSEDLDFSLLNPNLEFDFSPFLKSLEEEVASFGFTIDAQIKSPIREKESAILSAFMKANTKVLLLSIGDAQHKRAHKEEKISIKLEIDTNPPLGFEVEPKLILNPTPFYVVSHKPAYLFAGKVHALLCREWKNRVKGRDWYDFIWFIQKQVPLSLSHLEARLQQTGHLQEPLSEELLLSMLKNKIMKIDWEQAKADVRIFIQDQQKLAIWSQQFFLELLQQIKMQLR